MKREKSFRRCMFGGFHPQDVVNYISRKSKEHREEVEALRSGADKLRLERDSFCEALAKFEEEKAKLASERANWSAEKSQLIDERQKFLLELETSAAKRETLEKEEAAAVSRIEKAKAKAEEIRSETAKLISESRKTFDNMNEKSRSSALEIVLELDKMRQFFEDLPKRFTDTYEILQNLERDPRPKIREFTPRAFDSFDTLDKG